MNVNAEMPTTKTINVFAYTIILTHVYKHLSASTRIFTSINRCM